MYAQVAVPLLLPALTYSVPEELRDLRAGDAVKVRVRRQLLDGVVLALEPTLAPDTKFTIRPIEGRSEDFPRLSGESLRTLGWAAEYYHCPIGEVLRGFLPPDPKPKMSAEFALTGPGREIPDSQLKGKIQRSLVERLRTGPGTLRPNERATAKKMIAAGWLEKRLIPETPTHEPLPPKESGFSLTPHQAQALEKIRAAQDSHQFKAFLLEGVTGSGKTEVYLRAAAHSLREGRNVLVVVPEIALTPQLVARFRSRLGENISVLHSGISDGQRSRQWHLLNRGAGRVCIGARSASFAPVANLGLVIVDEEHDSALKQEDHLRYHARDLATMRAKFSSAVVLLGSATPSLESLHNALAGRYDHILLPERASGRSMPEVIVVDRSKEAATKDSLSPRLRLAMEQTLASAGQVMLLLNRRGFSSFLLCGGCGHVPECANCSVSLTNYRQAGTLKCHYCGFVDKAPSACAKCAGTNLFPGTLGTESLEEEVKSLFPGRKVIRIDRESTERKGSLEAALGAISSGEAEIVIGTQIIAKGHDFPNIALVGVVNADSSFHLPDFRASEKSFQLFTQMAGRAGRGERPGKVILQTFNPKHPSIVHSMNHAYRSFAEEELRFRHAFQYPPYTRMARVVISASSAAAAEEVAEKLAHQLETLALRLRVEMIGPAPAALTKIQNRYRWHLILRATSPGPLHAMLLSLRQLGTTIDRKVTLQVDVDPVSLM